MTKALHLPLAFTAMSRRALPILAVLFAVLAVVQLAVGPVVAQPAKAQSAASQSVASQSVGEAEVLDVRFGRNAQGITRIVLDIEGNPYYRAYLARNNDGAERLAVEIAKASFTIAGESLPSGGGTGLGHIGEYTYAEDGNGLASLRFDIDRTAVPKVVFLIKPKGTTPYYRLVIDLTDARQSDFDQLIGRDYGPMKGGWEPPKAAAGPIAARAGQAEEAGRTEPSPASSPDTALEDNAQQEEDKAQQEEEARQNDAIAMAALQSALDAAQTLPLQESAAAQPDIPAAERPVPRLKPQLARAEPAGETPVRTAGASSRKRKVIVDAGHGGRDPGSLGTGDLHEKDVTLAAALALEEILTARGYEVVMTRRSDVKIELEDRMPRWRKVDADLFLSIHADSIANKEVRGASVYTLSSEGEGRLARSLKREDDAYIAGVDLTDWDPEISAILADFSTTRAQEDSAVFANLLIEKLDGRVPMVNNTHRQENLKVLLAPDMPAVLLELGFMSNIHDEANLVRDEWRRAVMRHVADGVDAYFDTRPSRHASITDAAR